MRRILGIRKWKRIRGNDTKDRQPRRTLPTRARIFIAFSFSILHSVFQFTHMHVVFQWNVSWVRRWRWRRHRRRSPSNAQDVLISSNNRNYRTFVWKALLFVPRYAPHQTSEKYFHFRLKLIKSHLNKSDPFNVNAARIHWLLSFANLQFCMWCLSSEQWACSTRSTFTHNSKTSFVCLVSNKTNP